MVGSQQTQNIWITIVQRRPNVENIVQMYTNVLCLLGYHEF